MNDKPLPVSPSNEERVPDSPAGLPEDAIPLSPMPGAKDVEKPAAEAHAVPPAQAIVSNTPDSSLVPSQVIEGKARDIPPVSGTLSHESLIGKFFHGLLGADTPTGRFMRPFLRVTALVVGMFALGLLACYLVIYQPVEKQLGLTEQQLLQSNDSLKKSQQELSDLNKTHQDTLAELDKMAYRIHLLIVLNQVSSARLALSNRASAVADQFLSEGKADLESFLLVLEKVDPQKAASILSNYNQAISNLKLDPEKSRFFLEDLWTVLRVLEKSQEGR